MSNTKSTQGQIDKPRIQGEGDYEAAKNYREATRKFIESGKVDAAERKAREQDPAEGEAAERAGRQRAREEDPTLHRDYRKGTAKPKS